MTENNLCPKNEERIQELFIKINENINDKDIRELNFDLGLHRGIQEGALNEREYLKEQIKIFITQRTKRGGGYIWEEVLKLFNGDKT